VAPSATGDAVHFGPLNLMKYSSRESALILRARAIAGRRGVSEVGLDGLVSTAFALLSAALLGLTFIQLARAVTVVQFTGFVATYSVAVTAASFLDFGGTQQVLR
jgi:hypothetical protein